MSTKPFPENDAGDAIGKWLLSLPYPQREKLFRLADYLNSPKNRAAAEAARKKEP